MIWLSGGPTLTQIRHIEEYRLIEPLREQDGVTIGMSAGSINMARQVVVAKDLDDAFYGLYDESFLVEKGGSIQFFGPYCRLCELV